MAAALALLALTAQPGSDQPTTSPDVLCMEDMPCWNCSTMGNRICGAPNESEMP
jgi:hypothetical protein